MGERELRGRTSVSHESKLRENDALQEAAPTLLAGLCGCGDKLCNGSQMLRDGFMAGFRWAEHDAEPVRLQLEEAKALLRRATKELEYTATALAEEVDAFLARTEVKG